MSEQYPPIDWSDLSNLEFVPGSGARKEGWEIVAVYRHERRQQMHWLVISKSKEGEYIPMDSDDFGCVTYDGRTPIIRNRPKSIQVPDYWVAFWPNVDPSNCQVTVTDVESIASDWEQQGALVEHHPSHDKAV